MITRGHYLVDKRDNRAVFQEQINTSAYRSLLRLSESFLQTLRRTQAASSKTESLSSQIKIFP